MGSNRHKKFRSPGRNVETNGKIQAQAPDNISGTRHGWLSKLNRLNNWQAALVITALGFVVFFSGLSNPFMGDDNGQIVDNIPVHSITNMSHFFEGSTFYNNGQPDHLNGTYYRPLMSVAFSLLYTLFGPQPVAFHLLQLLLAIGSSFVLYLVFRYSFKPPLALTLALIFLIHPIDSQAVLAIPSMQEPLFFLFGILALWLLIRFGSMRSLLVVAVSLALSLFSKETGILFVAVSLLYLFWFDRQRLYAFAGIMIAPIVLWLALKVNAVGLVGHSNLAQIDYLSLPERLLTSPSILLFYLARLLFPLRLASGYYWVNSPFSLPNFIVPLLIDVTVVGLAIYLGILLRRRASNSFFLTYVFFAIWTSLGLLLTLQIIPLDFTACETWFYFPMAGFLGMVGVAISQLRLRVRPISFLIFTSIVLVLLGFRTALRGTDYKDEYTLAVHDIAASKEDYHAYNVAALVLRKEGNLDKAKEYAQASVSVYPTALSYSNLGLILYMRGEYRDAEKAYQQALNGPAHLKFTYDYAASLAIVFNDPSWSRQVLEDGVKRYPDDVVLWMALALLEQRNGDNVNAKVAITEAKRYAQVPQNVYDGIMNNQSFSLNIGGKVINY